MDNRVRELRRKAGLTQDTLATAAGTCVEHIRRIEAGLRTIPRHIANDIADTVGVPLERIFPHRPADIDDPQYQELLNDPEAAGLTFSSYLALLNPGTDLTDHTAVNAVQVHFRGGHRLLLAVTDEEQSRLYSLLNDLPKNEDFVLVDALDHLVVLNMRYVARIQLLLENSGQNTKSYYTITKDWSELDDYGLLWLSPTHPHLHNINVEPDPMPFSSDGEEPPLASALFDLESSRGSRMFNFEDIDGEQEFISTDEIETIAVHKMFLAGNWEIWNEEALVAVG